MVNIKYILFLELRKFEDKEFQRVRENEDKEIQRVNEILHSKRK